MKGHSTISFCVAALLVGAAFSSFGRVRHGQGSPAQGAAARPALRPCTVPGVEEQVRCGTLTVFENRETRTGRTISLNVVVMPALEEGPKEAPLFDLEGGPGAAATGAADLYATELKEVRRHRDVVLVDQRGTGGSNPLQCPHDTGPQHFLDEMYPVEYVKRCRAELERRADLTQYTTPVAADDLDDVRAWLGYERINLYGSSYGTRAAMVYMRQHPERVRSAVLLGPSPTYHKLPLYHSRDGNRAMSRLLDECAADRECQRAFPRLRQELDELLAELGRRPARAKYALPEGGEVTVEIQRGVFAEKLRSRLYNQATARRLPFVIHSAARGDFGPFLRLVIPDDRSGPDFVADGMYLSVTCAEDTPFIDAAAAARAGEGSVFGDYRVFQQRRACGLWPRAKLPAGYGRPAASNAPVLIITGEADPVTPPQWGEEVARQLPNSRHVVIPHAGHGPGGLSNVECMSKLIVDFVARGDARGLDASCVSQMLPPPFLTEAPKRQGE